MGINNIVIVDDEIELAEMLKEQFQLKGASNVLTFSSADAAFNHCLKQIGGEAFPEILITDYKMPKVTGLDLVRKLRGNQDLKSIPIIMMTAHGEEELIRNGAKAGIKDFIMKPFKMEFIQKRVEVMLLRSMLKSSK